MCGQKLGLSGQPVRTSPAAPIRASGASPLRVATGGDANANSSDRLRRSPASPNRRRDGRFGFIVMGAAPYLLATIEGVVLVC